MVRAISGLTGRLTAGIKRPFMSGAEQAQIFWNNWNA
jgi:hypothetical protein